MSRISYIAWTTVALALSAWAGVGFFAWTILNQESDRAGSVRATQESSEKGAAAMRTHSLAQETAYERTQLATLFNVDVVSAATLIESVGKASGVEVRLGGAQPESAPPTTSGPDVQAVGFVVEANGKFAALMRAAQLFETLPIPSVLTRVDIEQGPSTDGASGVWHMSAYIRVLTTSNTSS